MSLADRRFLFVTGKGGVGKTTVCAALADLLSGRGQRVLLTTSDPKERLSTLLGVPPLDSELTELRPNLWGVNIRPEVSLSEYGRQILKGGFMHRAVFGNRYVQNFFRAVPGLYQWAILGKAWFHSTEEEEGRPRFDTVIFDAPATGHALSMLWVPQVITEVARSGRLYRDAVRAWEMFQDPAHSGFCVVNLPEEVPTTETEELVETLRGTLKLPIGCVIQNASLVAHLTRGERAALAALDEPLAPPTQALRRRAEEERTFDDSQAKLHALCPGASIALPRLLQGAGDPAAIRALATALEAELH